MVFSTIIFLCAFLPIVIIGYYLMPGRGKNLFLLFSSLFFYAWGEPVYVLVMLLSIFLNYCFGMGLAYGKKKRKLWFFLAVMANLGILGVFKYAGFVLGNIGRLIPAALTVPAIALPIGISFYTFQGLSYCIDVYRDKSMVQKNPFDLALYISMFPQLIAGPIVRYGDIAKDLKKRSHTPEKFARGAERFIMGLAKKAILANTMGSLADRIMGSDLSYLGAAAAWIGAIAYTFQIYFDFSGYSDMAIGLGHIFGFHFPENFNYPYISKSVREFWRRWHISLSSWFRDYLYIPLGGSRRGNVYFHLFLVFLATGLWHGAAWGFVLWGLWHGAFCIIERWMGNIFANKERENSPQKTGFLHGAMGILGHVYTLLVVIIGWVLFKLVDLGDTVRYLKIMFGITRNTFVAFSPAYYLNRQTITMAVIAAIACLPWKNAGPIRKSGILEQGWFVGIKRCLLLLLLALCFVFIITGSYNPFIYFRF